MSSGQLKPVRPGLWRSDDGRWEAERRDAADVRRRDWVLREYVDGEVFVVDGPVGVDFPTLRACKEYVADA